MSSKTYDGVKILTEDTVLTPLGNGGVYSAVRKLTLADGRELFGCTLCDNYAFVAATAGSVNSHARSHRAIVDLTTIADMTFADAAALLVAKVSNDGIDWRSRALAAEKDLAKLRKILGVQS